MEASRADFERAARSTNLSPPDPSPESIFSPSGWPDARYSFFVQIVDGDRISAHEFRSAIVLDKRVCPHCHRRFFSVSSARHHVRHQSCQRSITCTARAVHCEVAGAKDLHVSPLPGLEPPVIAPPPTEFVSTPVNHVDLRFYGNNQEAQDGGPCQGRHHSGELRHPVLFTSFFSLAKHCAVTNTRDSLMRHRG